MKVKGFTLIEFLLATVIGMMLIAAALSIYLGVIKSNAHNVKSIHLAQDLRAAQDIITRDIKRTGYWPSTTIPWLNTELALSSSLLGTATLTDNNSSGLFGKLGTDIVGLSVVGKNGQGVITQYVDANNVLINITKAFDSVNLTPSTWTFINPFVLIFPTTETTTNCILLTYSLDKDNTIKTNESIGYRLNNNSIQMFQSGTFACDAGTWENMTAPTTQITALQFTLNNDTVDVDATGPGTSTIISRSITVSMAGQDSSDSAITLSLTNTTKIANDLYVP